MSRARIAAARVKVALARESGVDVEPWIAELAKEDLALAASDVPPVVATTPHESTTHDTLRDGLMDALELLGRRPPGVQASGFSRPKKLANLLHERSATPGIVIQIKPGQDAQTGGVDIVSKKGTAHLDNVEDVVISVHDRLYFKEVKGAPKSRDTSTR